jgi:hypothetical protein
MAASAGRQQFGHPPGLPSRSSLGASLGPDRFIVSPLFDGIFFIGSPLLATVLVLGAWSVFPAASIQEFVLLYMAVGHHVPTFLRAYGDPDEFRENRFRLLLIPLIVLPLMIALFLYEARLLGLIFLWDQYHFVRQHYGFMRIYDAKNGSVPESSINLDLWLCFSWFLCILAHSEFYRFVYTSAFFDVGMVFPAWTGELLAGGTLAVAGVVTLLYGFDLWRRFAEGQPISLLKLAITLTTYGCWYFSYVVLSHPLLSYPISSFFHCLQYDAIAWRMNGQKARSLEVTRKNAVFRYLHATRLPWLYGLAIFAYGFLSHLGAGVAPGLVFLVNRTTGVLHYYFDSFIWRVRRPAFRQQL